MSKKNTHTRTHPHDEIAACARAIWEEKGCPQGQDEEIWFEAERRLQDGFATDEREIKASADTIVAFNENNEPTGRVESSLRRRAARPGNRSATSV